MRGGSSDCTLPCPRAYAATWPPHTTPPPGTLPASLGFCEQLLYLDLSGHALSGGLPPLPPSLQFLNLSSNALTHELPDLAGTQLQYLDLSFNRCDALQRVCAVCPSSTPRYCVSASCGRNSRACSWLCLTLTFSPSLSLSVSLSCGAAAAVLLPCCRFSGTLQDMALLGALDWLDLSDNGCVGH